MMAFLEVVMLIQELKDKDWNQTYQKCSIQYTNLNLDCLVQNITIEVSYE